MYVCICARIFMCQIILTVQPTWSAWTGIKRNRDDRRTRSYRWVLSGLIYSTYKSDEVLRNWIYYYQLLSAHQPNYEKKLKIWYNLFLLFKLLYSSYLKIIPDSGTITSSDLCIVCSKYIYKNMSFKKIKCMYCNISHLCFCSCIKLLTGCLHYRKLFIIII